MTVARIRPGGMEEFYSEEPAVFQTHPIPHLPLISRGEMEEGEREGEREGEGG